jgi:hypothetical protein
MALPGRKDALRSLLWRRDLATKVPGSLSSLEVAAHAHSRMLPWARFSFVEPTELIGTVLEIGRRAF